MTAIHNCGFILEKQRSFFKTHKTLPLAFRKEQLIKLKKLIQIHSAEIIDALKKDLHKSETETVSQEIAPVLNEIDLILDHLAQWIKPQKTKTPFLLWPGQSKIYAEPYGTVLIIAPWNYPFMLALLPLIGAVSAGNCVIVKPSEIALHTESLLLRLLNTNFSSEHIYVLQAEAQSMPGILEKQFNYIFFTGAPAHGKLILEKAAAFLTPVTLELGGKSPCFVDETADLNYAARRIIWAKMTNAGQVCIAPDYVLIHSSRRTEFIEKLIQVILHFYGDNPIQSKSYGRIINKKHFVRLTTLLKQASIRFGGQTNEKENYISPTLIENITWDHPLMQEEIFGPILPVLAYEQLDETIEKIKSQPKPLALYVFSRHQKTIDRLLNSISFGGGCINDCLLQIVNIHLPFGGVGQSGLGKYRGKYSFETFSNRKPIYKRFFSFDVKLAYPPYTDTKLHWLKKLLKIKSS